MKIELEKKIEKIKKFKEGFKQFISKGDVLKLSIAFIMGQLFSKVVSSLTTDILMPPMSWIFSKTCLLSNLKFHINENISINYGIFFQNVFEFFLVSFFIYIILSLVFKRIPKNVTSKSADLNLSINKNIESLEKQQTIILKEIKEILSKK
jgi:large conductance mechanosensitive channel